MWSIILSSTLLAINLPALYGDVSHLVNNKHPGYGHHKPDQPLEYPGKGTNTHESHSGYPKVVPDNQLQIPSTSNIQTQYPGGDSITAGANSGGVVTQLQTHTDGGHRHHHDHHHNHGADGKYDPHDDGTGWDIRKSVPGEPEQDYPTYATVPRTTFTCAEKVPGYYADTETRCQAFRICTTRSTNSFTSFLCPNGTIFNQAQLTCDWWNNVDCEHSDQYYYKNNEIGQMPEGAQLMYMVNKMLVAPAKKPYNYNGGKIEDSQEQGSGVLHQGIYLPPKQTTQKPLTTKQPYQFNQNVYQNIATKPSNNHFIQQQQEQSFNQNNYAQSTTQEPIHSVVETDYSSEGGYQYQQHGYIPPTAPTDQQTQLTLQEIQFAQQQETLKQQQEAQLYEQKLATQKAQQLAIQKAEEERKQAELYQQSQQNIQKPVPQENTFQQDLQQHIQQTVQQEHQHNVQDNVISNYSPARPEYNQIDYNNQVGETTPSTFTSFTHEATTIPTLFVSTMAPETTPPIPFVSTFTPEVSTTFDTTDNSDNQGTLFLSTLAPVTVTPGEESPPLLHVSQVIETMDPQPLFVSQEKPQLFTSQIGNQLFISNTITKKENNSTDNNNPITSSPFVSQLTPNNNPQPLFVSPIINIGSGNKKEESMLFTSPIVSPTLPVVPEVPIIPIQTRFASTISTQSTTSGDSSQVQPAVTFTKENTHTVTQSEKSTHTVHGTQNADLGKGPQKISLLDNKPSVAVPLVQQPQFQTYPSFQNTQTSTSFQTDGYHQVPKLSNEQTIQNINKLEPTHLHNIPSFQNTQTSTSFQTDGYHQVPKLSNEQAIQSINKLTSSQETKPTHLHNIPSFQNTQTSTSFQADGYHQVPQLSNEQAIQAIDKLTSSQQTQLQNIPSFQNTQTSTSFQTDSSKDQAIQAINKLTSSQHSLFGKTDNTKLGHGLIDVRDHGENPIRVTNPNFGHQKSVDFPSFSQKSFESIQDYQFPSETPSFHLDNFHHINSHLKTNNQRVNYEFSNDKTANNYQGQGVANFGNTHHSYTGQNLGLKQTTRVEIVPAIGFEISDPVGRNNFQSALQNGLFKDRGYQALASQNQFHPSDARFSSYHGPSSYLVPQMSVQQLPSNSGVYY